MKNIIVYFLGFTGIVSGGYSLVLLLMGRYNIFLIMFIYGIIGIFISSRFWKF